MKRIYLLLAFLLVARVALAQNEDAKTRIANAFSKYFELDRENLHVQFDKTIFFTNETVWFKGYCFNKKEGKPFFETTNVFAVLYDGNGNALNEQLLFSYSGTFSGSFKLRSSMSSGFYYIRFYTNWMNNFPEDDAATYRLQIINENDTSVVEYPKDFSKINITFFPEGGQLVANAINNIGILITDCDGNPTEATDARIVNSKGELMGNFLVGKNGCGKMYLSPTQGETYKALVTVNGKTFDAVLPPAGNGLSIEVNNYAVAQKTIVKLRTNTFGAKILSGKALYLVAHQNEKATIFETAFSGNGTECELIIGSENLYPGPNIIRVIDGDMNELAQRIIFESRETDSGFFLSQTATDKGFKIVGYSNYPNANLSVSVLPDQSLAAGENDIFSSFLTNPYVQRKFQGLSILLSGITKAKKYSLDLMLLNQPPSQYSWKNIMAGPAKINYDFDIGLTIKGSLNKPLSNPKKYRMLLSSPMSLINDYTEINEKNEFIYKNLVFADDANFRFTLLEIPSIPVPTSFLHQIQNRRRSYNKALTLPPIPCAPGIKIPLDAPQFGKDVIMLDNIELTQKKKSALKYESKYGNASLRGYKINEEYAGTDLINFIGSHGFNVSRNAGRISITGRGISSFNGPPPTPEVYLNGRRLISFDELDGINTDDVDEIYMNANTIIGSMNNNRGVIKIYMKELGYADAKSATKLVDSKEGFAPIGTFEPPLYISTNDQGFKNYGIIHWIPYVLTDDKGNFSFDIPKTDIKSVTVRIQGVAPDGKLISESRTIVLP